MMFVTAFSILLISSAIGIASSIFLYFIIYCYETFSQNHYLIWALPLFGIMTIWTHLRFNQHHKSTSDIIHKLHLPEFSLSLIGTPLTIIFTSLSQLFGASTGREGAAIQFGASISHSVYELLIKNSKKLMLNRETYIRMGIASGFGAVFGLPLAGGLFSIEISKPKEKMKTFFLCLLSSTISYIVCRSTNAPHTQILRVEMNHFELKHVYVLISLTLSIALIARIYNQTLHSFSKKLKQINPYSVVIAGTCLILVLSVFFFPSFQYNGLGLNLIKESFQNKMELSDVLIKTLFTLISVLAGLKGGEFVPLMSIGAMLGSFHANYFALTSFPFAAIGLFSLVGSAIGMPLTASLACYEYFGPQMAIICFICTTLASHLSGKQKLYADEI